MKKKVSSYKWDALQPGDIVDVVAPGFSTSLEKLNKGLEFLRARGLRPRVPDDLFGDDLLFSNADEVRLRHLKRAIYADDSKAIWCVRGGYGGLRLMPDIAHWKKPKKNKILIGFSDTTTLHQHWNQKWGFATLQGPHLDKVGLNELPPDNTTAIVDILFGRQDIIEFPNLLPLNKKAQGKGIIKAAVAGGNLAVLCSHIGTQAEKTFRGKILFLEDIGERGYRIDRMLQQLHLHKSFIGVKAIVFGEFTGGNDPDGKNRVPDVLKLFANEMGTIPVFSGMPCGHGAINMPLPFATKAQLKLGAVGALTVEAGFR